MATSKRLSYSENALQAASVSAVKEKNLSSRKLLSSTVSPRQLSETGLRGFHISALVTICAVQYVWMVLFLALNFLTECSAAPVCTTLCDPGSLCHRDDCNPCPDGEYQSKKRHKQMKCVPWSSKPEYGEWVIDKEGNATADRTWTCAPGYELRQFTVDKVTCIQKPTSTTPSPGTNSAVSPKPTAVGSSTTEVMSSPVLSSEEESNYDMIIGCSVGGVVGVVVLIIVIVFVCYRKKKLCFSRQSHETENGNAVHETGNVTVPLLPDLDRYFHSLMENNSVDEITVLMKSLPHHKYISEMLKSAKSETDEPKEYYAKALRKWAEKYPTLQHRNLIENLLHPDTPC